jgi:phosphoglycerate dehydrogenase-like enzyme
MALSRKIVEEDKAIRNGLWQTTIGRDLKGQTLGIIGLGRHGSNLARFGQAFGMRVIAWSQNLTQ